MPVRLQTEPPEQLDVEEDRKVPIFVLWGAVLVGLAVIGLVLRTHFR